MSFIGQTHLKCSVDPERQQEYLVNGKSKYGYSWWIYSFYEFWFYKSAGTQKTSPYWILISEV